MARNGCCLFTNAQSGLRRSWHVYDSVATEHANFQLICQKLFDIFENYRLALNSSAQRILFFYPIYLHLRTYFPALFTTFLHFTPLATTTHHTHPHPPPHPSLPQPASSIHDSLAICWWVNTNRAPCGTLSLSRILCPDAA